MLAVNALALSKVEEVQEDIKHRVSSAMSLNELGRVIGWVRGAQKECKFISNAVI